MSLATAAVRPLPSLLAGLKRNLLLLGHRVPLRRELSQGRRTTARAALLLGEHMPATVRS
eukprot:10588551-Alexandrium_andersonii.AAC.1